MCRGTTKPTGPTWGWRSACPVHRARCRASSSASCPCRPRPPAPPGCPCTCTASSSWMRTASTCSGPRPTSARRGTGCWWPTRCPGPTSRCCCSWRSGVMAGTAACLGNDDVAVCWWLRRPSNMHVYLCICVESARAVTPR